MNECDIFSQVVPSDFAQGFLADSVKSSINDLREAMAADLHQPEQLNLLCVSRPY
jgi:hypothetical protein